METRSFDEENRSFLKDASRMLHTYAHKMPPERERAKKFAIFLETLLAQELPIVAMTYQLEGWKVLLTEKLMILSEISQNGEICRMLFRR